MKEILKGVKIQRNKNNKFFCIFLHYTADPQKRTKQWRSKAKAGMTEDAWQMEYELNFYVQKGKRVFPEFDEKIHIANLEFNPELLTLIGWDFGYLHPACVVTQVDKNDCWLIIDEILGKEEPLEVFIQRLFNKPYYSKIKSCKHFCDPAGAQHSGLALRTSIEILNAYGIYPIYKKSNPEERARIIRTKLLLDENRQPQLLVNKSCKILIEGFLGGYHYVENETKEIIEKDGYYDHLFDALGYIAYSTFFYKSEYKKYPLNFQYKPRTYNEFTGW
jgi:hypothetical protein